MKKFLLTSLLAAFTVFEAVSAVYYIRTDGNDTNDGLSNTSGGAWLTLAKAASTVVAGDTVRVQAGIYTAGMSETTDGSSGSEITYVADGSVIVRPSSSPGISITGDFVRFIGFNVQMATNGAASRDAISFAGLGVEIWNNTVSGHTRIGITAGGVGVTTTNSIVLGNRIIGQFGTAGTDAESAAMSFRAYNSLIGYNVMNRVNEDYVAIVGENWRLINNYGDDSNTNSAAHVDFYQIGARSGDVAANYFTRTNLVEANYYIDAAIPADHHHFSNVSNDPLLSAGTYFHLLNRRNLVYRTGTGVQGIFETWSNLYFIHETYVSAQRFFPTELNGLYVSDDTVLSRVFNSIFYEVWGTSVSTGIRGYLLESTGIAHDYNLGYDPDGSVTFAATAGTLGSQSNGQLNADPDFVNAANDWRLGGSSQATGNAGRLTTVTSGNGTGTSFDVADGGFFRGDEPGLSQYGGNLVVGDRITVGTDQLTISSISGNTITVTTSFTWATNDAVYWGLDTTPDIGAYPADHVPLSAATIAQNGDNYTVNPDGDTRFVVFFADGVPHTVDNTAPYTATIASGAVTARAYPLYASATTSVLATEGGGPRTLRVNGMMRVGTAVFQQ